MKTAQEILRSHNKFHITLGLDRIQKIMDLLSNPEKSYKIIHIAGTNGKGSTSKIVNDILIENFKKDKTKIGLFTSPHLFSYTERIKVNNENISEYVFDILVNKIDKLAIENNIELSEFELITAVAFYYFFLKQVDYVVLEVGLGGLLDSTNIVNSIAQIITTIDFDHKERLGQTIEEIATQKAGIIKENSKVAILKSNKGYEIIKKIAENKKTQLIPIENIEVTFNKKTFKNMATYNNKKYTFNLLGSHQAQNLSLALSTIKSFCNIKEEALEKALKNIKWDFRLNYNQEKNLLIDAAHNPQGIKSLCNFIYENFNEIEKIFIFGCLKNKDYNQMLNTIIKNKTEKDKILFYSFNYPNALKYQDLNNNYKKEIQEINKNDLSTILSDLKPLKIVCGSIYMLGEIFKD